jgi:hypothetical protein
MIFKEEDEKYKDFDYGCFLQKMESPTGKISYINPNKIPLTNFPESKSFWYYWSKALGAKEGRSDADADRVAMIRTGWLVFNLIVGVAIVCGILRHW